VSSPSHAVAAGAGLVHRMKLDLLIFTNLPAVSLCGLFVFVLLWVGPPIVHSILEEVVLGGVCLLAQCMWQPVLVRCVFWLV
jgi:hypothetical protein